MPNPSTVILIVAHGSRNPLAAEEHTLFCDQVGQSLGEASPTAGSPDVRPAYLEITEPSVAQAIDRAVGDGATTIRVLPHFLNSGNHVLVDLPAIIATETGRHPGVEISLEAHLGSHPGLVKLTADRIHPAGENRPT